MVRSQLVARQPPSEPILDMAEIQGIAIPGFFKPHQTLLYLRLPEAREVLDHFKSLLGRFSSEVATAAQTLDDRRRYRQVKRGEAADAKVGTILVAIGFSHSGLVRLTPGAADIPDIAFRHGLVARSRLLGDPTDPSVEGHPSTWVVGAPGRELDALVVVAGDERPEVTARAKALMQSFRDVGLDVGSEDGDVRTGNARGHEHFGFDDGVSQPGPRGLASIRMGDYITDRHIDPREMPESWLYGYPGQDLVWPGELILGYPATSPDPLVPGPVSRAEPGWTRNGAFLVYRRLRQDVGLFWHTMRDEAARLAALPGFSGLTDDVLAARLVGRWQSGAAVNRVPDGDNPQLGHDPFANNYFRFDSDTPSLRLRRRRRDPYPMAKADPVGVRCPWAAHIRKINTRDSASDLGANDATYNRRLLRVGIPFGPSLADRYADTADDPAQGNRGLLFLSIQSSIEGQFEFLQARWANDPSRPKMPGGNDMIIGQNAVARDRIRRCTIFGSGLEQAEVRAAGQWVIPTGGGYFFVPSVSALRDVIAR
jgi:Dyp-type peroxidase family